MNFGFSIIKKISELAHEKLVDMMGGQRILDQYSWNNLRNGHLFTRLLYSDHSFWSGTCIYNFLPLISIQSPEKSELPAVLPAS